MCQKKREKTCGSVAHEKGRARMASEPKGGNTTVSNIVGTSASWGDSSTATIRGRRLPMSVHLKPPVPSVRRLNSSGHCALSVLTTSASDS